MRLTAKPLTQVSPALLQDLVKLPLPVTEQELPAWLAKADSVWVATFNQKTIGLLMMDESQTGHSLTYFGVREATRRRGVGSYLLQQALQSLPSSSLVSEAQSQNLSSTALTEWQSFLVRCGWRAELNSQNLIYCAKLGE